VVNLSFCSLTDIFHQGQFSLNLRNLPKSSLLRSLGILVAVLVLIQPRVFAQSEFATLSGTVRDGSGAAVSVASVTVKVMNSTETRKTVTNQDGYFTVSTLLAGSYQVTVEMKGFEKWRGSDITLNGSDSRAMNIVLKVGSTTETVEVQGTVTNLAQTDSGEKSALITSQDLQNLSLVGRNATEFLKILPGATMTANGGVNGLAYTGEVVGLNGFSIGGNAGGLSGVNINGQGVNITQDGQNTFDPGAFGSATPVNPNPDMISEVKVLTSNFSSENAQGPVVVNTVTKSGGSQFHGAVYMYARNSALNADDKFNEDGRVQAPKPNSSYYYPGFNIGGPVIIPRTAINQSRRKLFFFEAYENYHQQLDGGVDRAFVPTADMINGDFSALATYGSSVGRFAMGTIPTAPAPGTWMGFDTRAAAGCTIVAGVLSQACIDPNAQLLMKNYLPLANVDPTTHEGFNYVQSFSVPQTSWQNVVRGDWNISDNTKVFVTWSRQRETADMPNGLWTGSGDWTVPSPSPILGLNGSDFVAASFVHVFSPTLTSETRYGYTFINFPSSPSDPSKILKKESGYPLTGIFNNPDTPAVLTWGQSFPDLGEVGHDYHPTMIAYKGIPSVAENLTKVIKTHTAKFGFYYEHVYNKQDNWGQYMGVFNYSPWATPTGNNYADMLMGIGQGGYFEQALPPPSTIAQNIAAFYAQDDWKITRRITIQYGLRFEHYAKPYAPGFGLAVFNPTAYLAAAPGSANPGVTWNALDSSVPLSGTDSRFLFFSPRIGAAIDIFGTGKTVVRGGWGKYRAYDSVQSNNYTGPAGTALGSVGWSCGQNDPLCPTWEGIDTHAFTPVFGHPNLIGTTFNAMDPTDDEQPLVVSYSLNIDQVLPGRFNLELSYVGNHGEYLQGNVNTNAVPLGTLNAASFTCPTGTGNITDPSCQQVVRPFSQYQGVSTSVTAGGSQFDSFQASLLRNVGFLSLQANYTFSKTMGLSNASGLTGTLPGYGASWLWGVSPIDRANVLSLAYVFFLPNSRSDSAFVRGFTNGWQISGITQIESGAQLDNQSSTFNLTMGAANSSNVYYLGTPDITEYALITCNPTSGLKSGQFLNPHCFSQQPVGELGTAGMPYMAGPRFWNSDLSVTKNFKLGERQNLQFRFAAFNFLNHGLQSFTTGDSNLDLQFNDLGQVITGTSCPATSGGVSCTKPSTFGDATYHVGHRTLELGLKYTF
jgi:hypothetical protein